MEAQAVIGLGAALVAAGLLELLVSWLRVETARGRRVAIRIGVAFLVVGAVLAAAAGLTLLV